MTEAPDSRVGTTLEGRYRIVDRLAAGGMGVVYKGELVAIKKPVAVKFLHDALTLIPDVVKRFQREATAMSKLAHPNLVSVLDSGLEKGTPYLVMDFVSGKSLAQVLAEGPMPATRAAGLARQILSGVKHAHQSHVVHRDLKPDNIILLDGVEGDFAKILDFGLAKVLRGEDSAASQLTNTGFALGTPGYMSPEQAKGTEADERSDLYAVGVILYHMVTGRKPFVADSPLAVLRMHMDDAPTPPTKVAPGSCSPELERVILRAMAKEPGDRWQSATEMAQALAATPEGREAAGEEPRPASRASYVGATGAGGARKLVGTVARVVLATAIIVAVVMTWSQLSKRSQQKVKRRIDDAVKMAQGAFESAKEGAKVVTEETAKNAPPPGIKREAPPPPVAAKKEVPPPTPPVAAKKEEAPTPPVAAKKEEAPPPPPAPVEPTEPSGPTAAQADDDEDEDTPEEPAPPSDTPGAKLEEQQARAPEPPPPPSTPAAKNAPKAPSTAQARAELAAGKVDAAIQTLYAVRRHTKGSAEVALLLGHAYFKKQWRTDGLREYDNAIKLMPSLRYNAALVRDTVGALDGPTHHLAYSIIWTRIGKPALPEVRRLARSARTLRTRARATHLAQQLAHRRR
ncbi:MAG TPA: serine/threonine-protein kinase [Polyangia bacterium]